MGNNKHKLNPDKTVGSPMQSKFTVSILGNIMEPAKSVKNLGVIVDAKTIYVAYVATISRN